MDAVRVALAAGVAIPQWASRAFIAGLEAYEEFEVDSLGEAFGLPDHKHRAAKHARRWAPYLVEQIDALRADGMSLEAAIEAVAMAENKSPALVKKLRDEWIASSRPFEVSAAPSAQERIFQALADGLRPVRKAEKE